MKRLVLSILTALAFTAPAFAYQTLELESHGWWIEKRAGEAPEGRHIHVEVPFPLHQVVTGTITLPVTVRLHNDPGRVSMVRIQVFPKLAVKVPVSLDCPGHECSWVVPVKVDTTKVPDGRWEFRITANIKDSDATFGKRFYQTTRWHATVANGNGPIGSASPDKRSPGAGGWYEGTDYMNIFCGPAGGNLIAAPISGVVSLNCKFDADTAIAEIDANSHVGNRGTVVLDTSGGSRTVTFDSRKFSNGRHKLFLRTCKTIADGTGCGQLVLPLQFAN